MRSCESGCVRRCVLYHARERGHSCVPLHEAFWKERQFAIKWKQDSADTRHTWQGWMFHQKGASKSVFVRWCLITTRAESWDLISYKSHPFRPSSFVTATRAASVFPKKTSNLWQSFKTPEHRSVLLLRYCQKSLMTLLLKCIKFRILSVYSTFSRHSRCPKLQLRLLNKRILAGFVQQQKKNVLLSGISLLASYSCGNSLKFKIKLFIL